MPMINRRAWLARAAGSTAALAAGMSYLREALAQGEIKSGVINMRGDVRVNGKAAQPSMAVQLGDVVETGRGETVIVVERNAFLVRPSTKLEIGGGASPLAPGTLRVLAGKLLSAFMPGNRMQISTRTATIGIRGTGLYIEVIPDCTYACTCYGSAELNPLADPKQTEVVTTTYHDSPRYIFASADKSIKGPLIEVAPVVNHQDAELIMLEGLVERKVPFTGGGRY